MSIYKNFGHKKWHKVFLGITSSIAALVIIFTIFSFAGDGTQTVDVDSEIPEISGEYASDTVLVRFKPGTSKDKEKEIKEKNGLEQTDEIPQIETKILKIKDKGNVAAKIKALSKNKHVIYAEPDYIVKADLVPNDPIYVEQWGLPAISAPTGWDINTGSESTTIAIIDTGLDLNHSEFTGRLVPGYDFVNNDGDPTDDNGHGTMVAGVAAASGNNGLFVSGIDWKAKIMPVKVMNSSGYGTLSNIAKGIIWAADAEAKVINMSLGSTTSLTTCDNAIEYAFSKNLTLIAASGNDSANTLSYPARHEKVIAVGALGGTSKATYSNSGLGLSLVAPGNIIKTTRMNNTYGASSGTSLASPHVAGLASLIKSVSTYSLPKDIKYIMEKTATDLGDPGRDNLYGFGRINMEAALKLAQIYVDPNIAPEPNTEQPPESNPEPTPTPTPEPTSEPTPEPTPTPTPEPTPTPTPTPTPITPPPADTNAPTVGITAPTSGNSIAGTVDVIVTATDNTSVSKVELLIDGKLYATSTVSPYIFSLDTKTLTNGTHTLLAKGYDLAGNIGNSTSVSVGINNVAALPQDTTLPTVKITSPSDGATVLKRTSISVNATDNVGVVKVLIYIDNKLQANLLAPPYSTNWNVGNRNVSKGEHTITAYAYDAAGNVATTSVRVVK